MASQGEPRPVPAGLVTVADLLNRNAPAPAREGSTADDGTHVVTVRSLMRREGRGTRPARTAAEVPAQAGPKDEQSAGTDRGAIVRRGAVAAGALLAAGSVFGAAALTDATLTNPLALGDYPGQGRLDGSDPGAVPPGTTVLDGVARPTALDAGTAAPQNWTPIAFPSALAAAPDGANGNGVAANTPNTPVPPTTTGSGTSAAAGDNGGGGGLVSSLLGGDDDSTSGGLGGAVSNTTKSLGDGVSGVTKDVPVLGEVGGAVGGLVETGGGAVGGLVSGLGNTVSAAPKSLKKATAPLTDALPVTKPVTDLLFGAADTLTSSAPRTSGDEDSSDGEKKSSSEGSSSSTSKGLLGSLLGGGSTASEKAEKSGARHAKAESDDSDSHAKSDKESGNDSDDDSGHHSDSHEGDGSSDDSGSKGDSGGVVGAATGLVGGLLGG